MSPDPRVIESGQQILHYRLGEKLGEGGMGQVWKALDLTLERSVAIKILPPAFAGDPDRLARFEREARLLASLNHPNIATLYSVHVVDDVRYLSMELVPGEDLAQRISRGPIPVAETIEIARLIALALEAAHESGVVHRDLKPANVRITPEGRVKVLDFGLAKALEASAPASSLSQSPTFAATSMATGMIIGTAAYMSPEQARGQSVDRRADIWAFGVVLYEMLTGKSAFAGETVSDVLAAVLRAEPERSALPTDLPPAVRALLERCLEKNPRRRLRDIGEAVLVLEDVQAGRVPSAETERVASAAAPARRNPLPWIAGMIGAAVLAALAAITLRPTHPQPLRKFTLTLKNEGQEVVTPAVSPNGGQLAYVEERKLWIRDLTQLGSRMLADGVDEDLRPLWSPDGAFVVFANGNGLARADVAGGSVTPICTVSDFLGGAGATWDRDGYLLFTAGHDHVYRVAAGGGVATVMIPRVDSLEVDLHHPFALPGGRGVLCVRHMSLTGPNVITVAGKGTRKDVLVLSSGLAWDPIYDPRGYIIYSRVGEGAGLWAIPFSLDRLAVTGDPFLIAAEGGSPSIASDGSLVYRLGTASVESRVVEVDRSGAIHDSLTEASLGNWSMALSPNGKQLVVEVRSSGEGDVWLYDLDRKAQTKFAFGPGRQGDAAWSPDGREIVYLDAVTTAMMIKAADGSQAPRFVAHGFLGQFTPDGRHIVYSKAAANGLPDIWYRTIGGTDSTALVQSPATESFAMPSPGGDYLLYDSNESGRAEIYLRQLPAGEGRWQVSSGGGTWAQWSRQGDRIYYRNSDRIFEVSVELAPSVRLGAPRELFSLANMRMQSFGRFNMIPTSNPDRFLMLKTNESVTRSHVDAIVVQNWPAEFAKKR